MANTYTLIASNTVSTAVSSVTFSSIPATYTDLCLKVSLRTGSVGAEAVIIEFNGATTGFTAKRLYGQGSSVSTDTLTNIRFAIDTAADTANTFANGEFYVPNYAGSNYKSVSTDGVNETNATVAIASLVAGLWSNTAAITSIKLTGNGAGSFVQYSTFYLYGIKNS